VELRNLFFFLGGGGNINATVNNNCLLILSNVIDCIREYLRSKLAMFIESNYNIGLHLSIICDVDYIG